MLSVDVENRSGAVVDEAGAVELAGRVLHGEGIDDGELGIAFVGEDEMRELKRTHLGIDEVTDVLSFPIDGREELPEDMPRALGDVVLCPQVVGDEWQWPLTHGLLHLVGYDHGDEMEAREQGHLASGVGSTEPPKSEGSALPARERECGVGSTEPPKSEGSALPARERE